MFVEGIIYTTPQTWPECDTKIGLLVLHRNAWDHLTVCK